MTSQDGTTKSQSAPKTASTPSEGAAKPEGSAPANYSRGEGQKPVTNAYKENWNRIYGKKKTKAKRGK
ncbi:MAG TPA: hypothetical protein VGI22_09125 [Xanthobacteraceae bacterium]|jgi:hypothetical protein